MGGKRANGIGPNLLMLRGVSQINEHCPAAACFELQVRVFQVVSTNYAGEIAGSRCLSWLGFSYIAVATRCRLLVPPPARVWDSLMSGEFVAHIDQPTRSLGMYPLNLERAVSCRAVARGFQPR
jgi:hypothetical protein